MSKQSQSPLSYKVIPVHRSLVAPNASGTVGKKREGVPKTANSSEAVSRKQMVCEESSNKSTPGTMNAKEATKILAEKRRLAREQRETEERIQKERGQSKTKDAAGKAVEGQQEEFLKLEDGQQQKEIKKGCPDPEDQKVLLQRIEEIMKRTRKTDSNASKAAEPFVDNTYEEDDEADDDKTYEEDDESDDDKTFDKDDEADDEDESESDDDSFDDLHPSDRPAKE